VGDPAEELAGAILDGRAVDWAAESDAGTDRSIVPYLREVARIVALYRNADGSRSSGSVAVDPDGRPQRSKSPPFEWGHLRVQERIGLGAFGEVYRAWDSKLDREVALKLLPENRSLPDGGAAILKEGRLLARVHHRNVVSIYGADRIDGRVGLWMELIDGETLQQAMERGRAFTPADAVRIGLELAGAIGAVHDAGLLHRDVKPQNIMLSRDGRVVLMDFGTGHDARTGEPHGLSGTPLYLAPELLGGRPPSVTTDVYSVGVVLFFLLTRTHPVRAETLTELYAAHQGQTAPDVRQLRPDVPRALALAIARALDPEPSRRQPTANVLAAELTAIYGGLLNLAMVAGVALGWSRAPTPDNAAKGAERTPLPAGFQPMLAVLPLQTLDVEPGSEELADGLTDSIIRKLAGIAGLGVRSRASSVAFNNNNNTPRDLADVAKQLAVNLVVVGTVRRSGSRARVDVQLVQVPNQASLWSGGFDSGLADIPALVDQISRAIATRLGLTIP
jgi:TolB-like protein/predicted Ser/Thr protein kinase